MSFYDNKIPANIFASNVNPRIINVNSLEVPGQRGNIVGGKINRKKINKISNKYKMKGSKKTVAKKVKSIKSKIRSRFISRKNISRKNRKTRKSNKKNNKKKNMKGGLGPNYPSGYSQFENNHPVSNTYSTGGPLSPSLSALANPVPYFGVKNNAIDNLNHNAANSSGHNVGSGFASKGWW